MAPRPRRSMQPLPPPPAGEPVPPKDPKEGLLFDNEMPVFVCLSTWDFSCDHRVLYVSNCELTVRAGRRRCILRLRGTHCPHPFGA